MSQIARSEKIVCRKCGSIDDYRTEKKSMHTAAICNGCDKYIKFISTEPPQFFFGLHKGTLIENCLDIQYLQWFVGIEKCKGKLKDAVEIQISKLKSLQKKLL